MRQRLTENKTAASGVRREISPDFEYNKKKLKHLKHILHNVNVSVGTLVSALNEFSKVRGRDISPDGHLGGLGYILSIKDIKEGLIGSIQKLGDVSDCLADELTNPRWNAEDDKEIKDLLKEKDDIEEVVEEEINPDDITTSAPEDTEEKPNPEEILESLKTASVADQMFKRAVRQGLVDFISVGTAKTI